MKSEIVLWGHKPNEPPYMERILFKDLKIDGFEAAKDEAKKMGFIGIRIARIDFQSPIVFCTPN